VLFVDGMNVFYCSLFSAFLYILSDLKMKRLVSLKYLQVFN
jgi:hypothetical protein